MDVNKVIRSAWPDWQLMDELGRGTFGVVYRARRQDLAGTSYAAIKVTHIPLDDGEVDALRAEGMTPQQSRTYFENAVRDLASEIRMMERVRGYTNIVTIEDYKIIEHQDEMRWDIFIRMELLTPLNRWLTDRNLTESQIIRLGKDMCSALEVCRKANIVHRDIKPENIFINSEGVFKLGDFGVSRNLERHTFNMSKKGTYNYMAPEVFNGTLTEADINDAAKVDICSLGLVLYRLANGGLLPFVPNKQLRTPQDYKNALTRRMSGETLPPPENVSPALAKVILKACDFNPDRRYATAEALRKALMDAEQGIAPADDPTPIPAPRPRTTEKHVPAYDEGDITVAVNHTPVRDDSDATVSVNRTPMRDDSDATVSVNRTPMRDDSDATVAVRQTAPRHETLRPDPVNVPSQNDDDGRKRSPLLIALIVLLALAVLGTGGYFGWKHFSEDKKEETPVAEDIVDEASAEDEAEEEAAEEAEEETVSENALVDVVFTPTDTPGPSETPTEAPTDTPEPTAAPTDAPTATPEPTATPTEAPTATPTPTPEPTATPTEAPTATPVPTATPTEAPTATPVPTEVPTATPEPTEVPTATPEPTAMPAYSLSENTAGYYTNASSFYTNKEYPYGSLIPDLALDGDISTAWNADSRIEGEWIEIGFIDGRTYEIAGFRIAPGYWKKTSLYQKNPRPREIRVSCDGQFAGQFTVLDAMDYQTFYFAKPVPATSVTFTILNAYPGTHYMDLAITELELIGTNSTYLSSDTWRDFGRTVIALHDTATYSTLQSGAKGEAVLGLQVLLRDVFHVFDGPANGKFDTATATAVNKLKALMEETLDAPEKMKKSVVNAAYWNNMIAYAEKLNG